MAKFLLSLSSAVVLSVAAPAASAQEHYLGEIFMTGASFCPYGSSPTNGQLLPINQNSALFSLLGTIYGGDGRTTFALPDLRGRSPLAPGQGPGLSNRRLGETGGSETQTLTPENMPSHSHAIVAQPARGARNTADDGDVAYLSNKPGNGLGLQTLQAGGNQPLPVMNPYLSVQFCIAEQGIYPSRN